MKHGDPRTPAWIERNLPAYTRENTGRTAADSQSLLMLVIEDLVPSIDEIGTWTPEQRLLADDWAMNVHLSASDNNNRVPACPEHLEPYRRRYPQRTVHWTARAVVNAMSADSGHCYHPTVRQMARLEVGIALMMRRSCYFTDAEIELFGAGEHGEMLGHFQRFEGFEVAQGALLAIFEELNDQGEPKSEAEAAADRRRAHA